MAKLILHIGHRKTGSSAIQSWLAVNGAKLRDAGFAYPEHGSFGEAQKGHVTQGNGRLIFDPGFTLKTDTLLSNEGLFMTLSQDGALDEMISRRAPDLHVVLYTRNVFEYLVSSWGQKVKTAGLPEDLDSYLLGYEDDHYSTIPFWINAAASDGFKLSIRNYSARKSDIIRDFLTTCFGPEFATSANVSDVRSPVNRSLTESETQVQLLFNRYMGKRSRRLISYPLVHELPDIRAGKAVFSEAAYDAVRGQISGTIAEVNEFVAEEDRIEIEPYEKYAPADAAPNNTVTLTHDQLEVIIRNVCAHMADRSLGVEDADVLRDVAMMFEKGGTPDLVQAADLMALAERARPNGGFIRKKAAQFRNMLGRYRG
ncbi:hypothetical protein VWY34_14120 [Phaeobacter sp. JH20_02]|uniref:hypothetical protein n=1 Tax=unclassified Phaeobacter TaxID=2621772 RepID=UPI003A8442DE